MSNWTNRKIGDVVTLEQGLAINAKTKHLIADEGIPLLRITDLINNKESQYIDKERVPKKFITEPSDIIYTRTGQVGLVFKGRIGVIHNNCFRVMPNSEVDPNYLFWFLKQPKVYDYVNSVASGAAQPDLNHSAFRSIEFSYPDIAVQKKIADVLSAYDDLIEVNTRRIRVLEQMAGSVYREWFGKVDEKSLLEGWEIKQLQDAEISIIDGDRGKNYPTKNEFYEEGYCLFLNAGNFKDDRFDYSDCDFITEKKDNLLRKGRLQANDIVLTTRGTVGKLAFFSENAPYKRMRINSGMVIIRPTQHALYWYFQLKSPSLKEQYKSFASGSAQPQLPIKDMNKINVLVPPDNMASEFCEVLEPVAAQTEILLRKNANLRRTRDLLLPRLVSGEIAVRE
ncbi:MAG TPA: restriction endonuclease subunit S [Oculatellaceae cyanobacterium]